MRMKKWKKVLIWVASIVVILGIGGLFAANYAVDKLISTLAADLENDLLVEDVLNETNNSDKPTDQGTEESTSPDGEKANGTNETDKANNSTDKSTNKIDNDKQTDGYSAEVSVDKAKDLQEKITVGEKAQVTGVLLKELSMSDIKELQALAKGGLSVEEKKKARGIILDKLTAEQYDELIKVAKKYGMSQGKSYDQVKKEK